VQAEALCDIHVQSARTVQPLRAGCVRPLAGFSRIACIWLQARGLLWRSCW